VHKTAASAAQLANCILLHAYSRTTAAPSKLRELKQKLHMVYSRNWYNILMIN